MKPDKNRARGIGFYMLIGVIILAVVFYLTTPVEQKEYTYSEIETLFREEKVKSFSLEGDELTLNLYAADSDGNTTIKKTLPNPSWFREDLGELIDAQTASGVLTEYDYVKGWTAPWWMSILPYLITVVLFIGVWYLLMNKSGGGGAPGVGKFGKAHTRTGEENLKKVTFADVAGAEEEKEELSEIVDFLKRPQNYTAMGARIPKGVLLVGPPGTGKTLMARAVAGEAGVQFLSISGSDFVELYVGVGASRVRDLFEQAKKVAPAIIFIDEIDAVGRQRGSGLGGGHDEREQTLNQLLVEMDGFTNNEGVIVMAATNRADILDNALLRPGRFDRRVYMGLPDIKGREDILKVHARGKPLGDDVDLKSIARGTAGGFTWYRKAEDAEDFTSRGEMFDSIVSALGGRIAEQLFLDDISTGASGDIQQATNVARDMVMKYGMSEKLGPISFDDSSHSIFIGRDFGTTKSYSEETAATIDEEVKHIFDQAYAKCEALLREHADLLTGLAEYLLIHETIEGDDFRYYCEHGQMPIHPDDTIEPPAKVIRRMDEAPVAPQPEAETQQADGNTPDGDTPDGGEKTE